MKELYVIIVYRCFIKCWTRSAFIVQEKNCLQNCHVVL